MDDIVETVNHFKCIDMVIDNAGYALSERFIKQLHTVLKRGTSDSCKERFAMEDYKWLPNEVVGQDTALPREVGAKMREHLDDYNSTKEKSLEDIIDFHYSFERSHPFQDGSGRVGRLIMFKECLRNNIIPFIIDEELKMFYYRGLHK